MPINILTNIQFLHFCFILKEEKRHDAAMLADSHIYDSLRQFAFSPVGEPMCIYGDPAYLLRVHLQAPFHQRVFTPQLEDFNRSVSAVRSSVEWIFGDIINYFKFLDFKKNLKIGVSQVGIIYIVCAILRNALTCMYQNMTANFFELEAPTLQEYFV